MHILTGCTSSYVTMNIREVCRIVSCYLCSRYRFTYTIALDGNRYDDGIDLRYRFGNEQGYRDNMIASYLDNRPCSVLEMIIALAIRLEEHIMDDPDIGNRTGQWFWDMIVSLGLGSMDDSKFDKAYAIDVIPLIP